MPNIDADPSNPVVDVQIERLDEGFSVCVRRVDGQVTMVRGRGLGYFGGRDVSEVLLYLLHQGVPVNDAARLVEQAEPGFNASAEIQQRSHADMAAWRAADVLQRHRLKEEFRRNRQL